MPRLGRYFAVEQTQYVVQRGHNLQKIFLRPEDYVRYSEYLMAGAGTHGCAINAFVLMPSDVHLLVTPKGMSSLPRMMQSLGRRYVRYFNTVHGRRGTLWDGRYRAAPLDPDEHFLACCRYIETIPVRAGLAQRARDHPWSSHLFHAQGAPTWLVTMHAVYRALAHTPSERQQSYRTQFRKGVDPDFARELRAAVDGGWVLGSDRYQQAVAEAQGRRTAPLPRGRPPKPAPLPRVADARPPLPELSLPPAAEA
jgi:putative transposase